ncbi:TPA: hypothetical protein HA253_03595 [Candidatus Woesearchaeota archaeon]|nr:hypothetical protein [Candidatus Woesearchaeota archaeon]
MKLERKSCCSTKLGMLLVLILLLIALPACTTQEVPQKTKQGQEEVQGEQKIEKSLGKEKAQPKEAPKNKTQKEEERLAEEQADNASIIGIPRFFQRRESARVTHISDELINMSYRENNRQVQFKVVNFEQDDGVRKRTIKYCFDKDSIFFKKRDIVHYHISTEVCNTYGKPYVALPIKIERES